MTDIFFAIRESDKKIVGIVDLRYQLNEYLKDFGHCGYSVRPAERNKGYATEMLAQICQKAKTYGIKSLQLSVERSNIPSIRTILKNGGPLNVPGTGIGALQQKFLLAQTIEEWLIELKRDYTIHLYSYKAFAVDGKTI